MKTLKLFRMLSMIAALAFLMIHCLPEVKTEAGYNWIMITVLVIALAIVPTSLLGHIKRENHPETLTEYTKGYLTINIVAAAIMIGLCTTCIILRTEQMWIALSFAFVALYNLFNSIILYNAKKAYDSENYIKILPN